MAIRVIRGYILGNAGCELPENDGACADARPPGLGAQRAATAECGRRGGKRKPKSARGASESLVAMGRL